MKEELTTDGNITDTCAPEAGSSARWSDLQRFHAKHVALVRLVSGLLNSLLVRMFEGDPAAVGVGIRTILAYVRRNRTYWFGQRVGDVLS